MLEGFGLAPVCIELDLDSYDGDWSHVARFRGRSGWLTVVEARLRTRRDEWDTTLVAACDEFGNAVPSFMAPNLLACACSLPEPCSDYPPEVLDHIIASEKAELKRRWLREHNVTLRQLSADAARSVEMLEVEARRRMTLRDVGIAELRRRRRMPTATHEDRTMFTELIEELENEQDAITESLAAARAELRGMVDDKEREILARTEIRVVVEPLYYVSWRSRLRPYAQDHLEAHRPTFNSRLAQLRARLSELQEYLAAAAREEARLNSSPMKRHRSEARVVSDYARRLRLERRSITRQITNIESRTGT